VFDWSGCEAGSYRFTGKQKATIMRKILKGLLMGLGAVALTGVCAVVARADIKIGAFGPMTGDAAGYGQSEREAIDLAVKDKNAAGGLLGQKIVVIYGDDAGKPEQAVSVAKRLATSDEVVVMLGSISSPASLAASQVALQTETAQIVIGGTAQRITTQGNPWVFRSAIPDTKFAGDLVDFLAKKWPDKKKVGFIYVNDDFGKGGFDAFKNRAAQRGIQIVAEEKYTRGDLDFASQLSRIRSAAPDFFVDWSRYTEASLIIKQAKQMGLTAQYVGSDGQAHPKFRELAGAAAEGAIYPTHFSVATTGGNKQAEAFVAKIRAAYNKDPDFAHAQSYDAATATFLAIEKAGSTDRTKFRDALKTVTFEGVRGHFKFDQRGDPTLEPSMVIVKGGKEADAR
jgi:branched-chain amino acid transport system substrate-binding protein